MAERIVAFGASAGGVAALRMIVADLPRDLDAAVLIVLHIPVHTPTTLHEVLALRSSLPVKLAEDRERLRHGVIYVAPTDRHFVVERAHVRLTRGPRENRVRPCIDVLFRSIALHYGARAMGVVLTGTLDDGTAGLWAIKDRGGLAIVQDPKECEWPSMPENALKHVAVDHVLLASEMGRALPRLFAEAPQRDLDDSAPHSLQLETEIAIEGNALKSGVMNMGQVSANTCPECHGVLVKIREERITRYRCHTGHAFSVQSLLADVDESIEKSLWNAMRSVEERALVLRDMESMATLDKDTAVAEECAEQARFDEKRAQRLRELIMEHSPRTPDLTAVIANGNKSHVSTPHVGE